LNLSFDRSREAWSNDIQAAFGPSGAGRLGSLLRSKLLIKTQNYRVTDEKKGQVGYPAEYMLNKAGYDELHALAGGDLGSDFSDVYPEHATELQSLEFEYKDKSNRYWHHLQSMKREVKAEFWSAHGLPFNYDIAACAPTILLQLANEKGISPLIAEPIESYLADRNGFRMHVGSITGLSIQESKQLINSFFNGATLAMTPWCKAYADHGPSVVSALIEDKKVRRLRVAIRALWIHIRRGEMVDRTRNGLTTKVRQRLNVRTAKNKWTIYFKQERRVLDTIIDYLRNKGIKHFTEHDGFRTNSQINVAELEQTIFLKTGFALTIEEEEHRPRSS